MPKGKSLYADTDDEFTRAIDLGRVLGQEQMSAKVKPT